MKNTNNRKELFQCASTIEKVETRRDQTLKLIIGTQELDPDSEAILMRLRNKIGWFMFSTVPIEDVDLKDIPDFIPRSVGQKSDSQLEREQMWLFWKNKTDQRVEFEEWRHKIIQRRIQSWKDKLNE